MRSIGKVLFVLTVIAALSVMGGLFYYYSQISSGKTVTLHTHSSSSGDFTGEILFVSNQQGEEGMFEVDPVTKDIKPLVLNGGIGHIVSVSPDGTKAVLTLRTGKESALYTVPSTGGKPKRISGLGNNLMPVFSPDGKKVIYVEDHEGASRLLKVVNLETSKAGLYAKPEHWYSDPSFLPDGRVVCTAYLGSKDQIVLLNPKAGTEINLSDNNYDNSKPDVSRDGSKIVFLSNRDGNPEIYTMNADGSDVHRLTLTTGVDYEDPSWSPDGKYIVFASNMDGDHFNLYVMDNQGNVVKRLTDNAWDDFSPRWFNPGAGGQSSGKSSDQE